MQPFAALLREDAFGQLVVIEPGSVYVTAGSERRSTGTHYTPRSLTEPIVQHTLEPLVYSGPRKASRKTEWKLKSPREILALKVCDMAMGSGAFLVQACRYLAERLVEAWEIAEKANPGKILATPEGDFSTGDLKRAASSRRPCRAAAHRAALRGRPLPLRRGHQPDGRGDGQALALAHHPATRPALQLPRPRAQVRRFPARHQLRLSRSRTSACAAANGRSPLLPPTVFATWRKPPQKRRALEDLPSNDHTQIETKNRLHAEAEAATAKVKAIADCLIAFELRGLDGDTYEDARQEEAEKAQRLMKEDANASLNSQPSTRALQNAALEKLSGSRAFHWPVEFPEVFARGGFDAFVGNSPFMGGQKITGAFGDDYRNYLVRHLANGRRGSADLCAYFFLRIFHLLRPDGGVAGLLATNTIAQGDTREVGLEQLSPEAIIRALSSVPWPGDAALEIAQVWLRRGDWHGVFSLNQREVSGITAFLNEPSVVTGKALALAANSGKAFIGSYVLGMGFVLNAEEAKSLLEKDSRNRDVILPYLNGEDIVSRAEPSPSRWVINFRDWPLEDAEKYPTCLSILRERVKSERETLRGRNPTGEDRARRWWQFARQTQALYDAIQDQEQVLTLCRVAKYLAPVIIPNNCVFDIGTAVFAMPPEIGFGLLQTSVYEAWVRQYSSTLETRLRFSPSDCFDTFPFPTQHVARIGEVGRRYHEQRRIIMLARQEGITKTYNRFHDRGEQAADILTLRTLHVELDEAVAGAYGWSDLDLGHGFHATKQGERYTISESARRTVLDRLLALNHERYEVEVKAGLHDKKKSKAKKAKSKLARGVAPAQPELVV